jgi:hypothetical protein
MLQPEKFGIVGAYSREALEAVISEEFLYDQQLLRLTTTILSGRTISERPEVRYKIYYSWREHLKDAISGWRERQNFRWEGADGTDTPPPWMVLLWPFLVLWPRFLRKHPVKMREQVVALNFEQRILYPEFDDIPAELGRPVIYESLDFESGWEPFAEHWGTSLQQASRFLNRHEIISEIYRAPLDSYVGSRSAETVLTWLEQRGVNVDQLVKRRYP